MKILKVSSLIIISGAMVLTNFISLPPATSMINPPKVKVTLLSNSSAEIDQNIKVAINKYLPKEAVLTNPINPNGEGAVQLKDLDGDGKNEVIVLYKLNDNEGNSGFIVLKEDNGSYKKVTEYKTQGVGVNFIKFAQLTKKGKNDLVVGWNIGATYKGMDIFTWKDNSLKKITSDWYTKAEVEDMEDSSGNKDGLDEIALWRHDTGEAYTIDVYKLKDDKLTLDKDVYPYYFKKVVPYYAQKVKEEPGAAFYWYYLADANLKAGNPKNAKAAAEKGIDILKGNTDAYPDIENLNNIVKSADNMLKSK